MFQKDKIIRLKGKKLHALYEQVWERDEGLCQEVLPSGLKCHKYVPRGTIPHHIRFKSQGGSDTLDNLKTLCLECHSKYH